MPSRIVRATHSLRHFLTPPIFPDEDDTYLAGLVYFNLMLILPLAPLFAIKRLLTFGVEDLVSWVALVVAIVTPLAVWQLRRGAIKEAAHYGISVVFLLSFIGGMTGSRGQATLAGFMLALMLAGLLMRPRTLAIYTVVSMVGMGVTLYHNRASSAQPVLGVWFGHALFLTATSLILARSSTLIWALLARARQGEQTLGERNRELQAEIAERQRLEQERVEFAVLQTKHQFLAEFLGNISHDLKTPLAVIKTNLYLLEKTPDPTRHQLLIGRLHDQTDHLGNLVQDIITMSRLDHSPELRLEAVAVNDLLGEILLELHSTAEEKQLSIVTELDATAPKLQADRADLRRALLNLVENAIRYTPTGGTITIRSQQLSGKVQIEVEDTGIGIGADDLPRIFDRFYRATEARELSRTGTGLGLAIVKRIVEMHRGEIDLKSTPGEGTRFRVAFSLNGAGSAA